MKITSKKVMEKVDSINELITDGRRLRATRKLDDTICFEILNGPQVLILVEEGMKTGEAYKFLEGVEASIKLFRGE